MALNVIRLIEENAIDNHIGMIIAELPIELATFLMNEKRDIINSLEKKHRVKIAIAPNKYINIPNYEVKAIKKSELPKSLSKALNNFNLSNNKEVTEYNPANHTAAVEAPKPAVTSNHTIPAPTPTQSNNNYSLSNNDTSNVTTLIKKLWRAIIGAQQPNALPEEKFSRQPKKSSYKKNYKYNNRSKNNRKAKSGNQGGGNERYNKNHRRKPHNKKISGNNKQYTPKTTSTAAENISNEN
jgi:ribonuclease E